MEKFKIYLPKIKMYAGSTKRGIVFCDGTNTEDVQTAFSSELTLPYKYITDFIRSLNTNEYQIQYLQEYYTVKLNNTNLYLVQTDNANLFEFVANVEGVNVFLNQEQFELAQQTVLQNLVSFNIEKIEK